MFATTWIAIVGVSAMCIPIIIHLLFRRKRRPVPWGAMRLLIEAVNRNKRRSRIENLLLLTLRCLVLLLVGLALAEPLLSGSGLIGSGSKHVILIVDDGVLSGMNDDDTSSPRIESTIDSAKRLVDELEIGERVSLISAGKPVEQITTGPTIDHQRVSSILESMTPGTGATDLAGAIELASTIVREQESGTDTSIILLGDWRQGSLGASGDSIRVSDSLFSDLESATTSIRLLSTLPSVDRNSLISIESIESRRPVSDTADEQPEVRSSITITRLGSDLVEENTTIRLVGEGIEETLPQPVSFKPGSNRVTIDVSGRVDSSRSALDGTSTMSVSLDDQTLPSASTTSVTIDTTSRIRVGLVDRERFSIPSAVNEVNASQWIEKALEPGEGGQIQVEFIDPISITSRSISDLDGLIVTRPDLLRESGWETIRQARDLGLFVLFVPPGSEDVHGWIDDLSNRFDLDFDAEIGVSRFDEPVNMAASQPGGSLVRRIDSDLNDLVAPVTVSRMINIDSTRSDPEIPLVLDSGAPFLMVWEPATRRRGVLALLTVSPDIRWTSLPVKPLMVPLLQEIVRQGKSASIAGSDVHPGESTPIDLPGAGEIRHSSGVSIQLDSKGLPESPIRLTGTWRILDSTGNALSNLVVNVDPDAIDPSMVSVDRFQEWLSPSGEWEVMEDDQIISELDLSTNDSRLSFVLLICAFALLLLETTIHLRKSRYGIVGEKTNPSGAFPT